MHFLAIKLKILARKLSVVLKYKSFYLTLLNSITSFKIFFVELVAQVLKIKILIKVLVYI